MDYGSIDTRKTRVVIVDDHAFARDAVRAALDSETRLEVVGEARSVAETLSVVGATAPDVIVLDFRLPDGDAPEVLDRLHETKCAAEIVVLTSYGERRNVRAVVDRGARSFLTKRAAGMRRVAKAVLDAHEGKATFSDDALSALLASVSGPAVSSAADVTDREKQVWRLVALGKSNSAIACELFVTERTVKFHVSNLLAKTGAGSRAALVALAYRTGLMDAVA